MPRNFTGQIDTVEPTQVPGTSIGVVNPLEGLDQAAQAADSALAGYALRGLEGELGSQETEQDAFLYDKSRELKRKMVEAGQQGNQDAVNRYVSELERLKVAERQGVIGPAAVETRRATIAKDYITRFPHLAADIKKIYNTTGGGSGGGGSSKEQFKDPVEDAQDKLITEWQATGGVIPLDEFIDIQTQKVRHQALSDTIDLRAKLGRVSELDLDGIAQASLVEAVSATQVVRRTAIAQSERGGEFDSARVRAEMEGVRDQHVLALRSKLMGYLTRSSQAPGSIGAPIVSPEFINSKLAELSKIYDDATKGVESLDQVKTMTRFNELAKLKGIENIRSLDATTAFVLTMAPDKAVDVLGEIKKAFEANATGFLSQFSAVSASPLARTAIEQVKKNPNITYGAFMNAVINGDFGDIEASTPQARAIITRSIRDTAIGNPSVPQEAQNNVAVAAYVDEKRVTGRGIPISAWYRDPKLANQLSTNPELKRMAEQDVSSEAVNIVLDLVDTGLVGKVTFKPQPELHGSKPWEFYKEGGPFSVPPTTGGYAIGNVAGASAQAGAAGKVLAKLNDGWNTIRASSGEAEANKWANDIMAKLDKKTRDLPPPPPKEERVTVDFADLPQ